MFGAGGCQLGGDRSTDVTSIPGWPGSGAPSGGRLTAPAPIVDARESLERLAELLQAAELADLVRSLEAIVDRSGYGEIRIEIKRRRIDRIAMTSTLKPGILK